MKWNTPSGATFALTAALALLTGLNWLTDGRASDRGRLTILETQISFILPSLARIEKLLLEKK